MVRDSSSRFSASAARPWVSRTPARLFRLSATSRLSLPKIAPPPLQGFPVGGLGGLEVALVHEDVAHEVQGAREGRGLAALRLAAEGERLAGQTRGLVVEAQAIVDLRHGLHEVGADLRLLLEIGVDARRSLVQDLARGHRAAPGLAGVGDGEEVHQEAGHPLGAIALAGRSAGLHDEADGGRRDHAQDHGHGEGAPPVPPQELSRPIEGRVAAGAHRPPREIGRRSAANAATEA